jgi:glycosyltransferase involved in cell wall biosynthesis
MAGTPVVTTAAGGAPEVVLDGETGFVVPCRDAEAVAGRVLDLLQDPGLRRRVVSAARDRMKRDFSADQAAARIQTCYEQGTTR